jgi:hypothetical protein
MLHALPFQCIVSVWAAPKMEPEKPTAHMSLAASTDIEFSCVGVEPRLGVGTMLHALPFHLITRLCVWLVVVFTV